MTQEKNGVEIIPEGAGASQIILIISFVSIKQIRLIKNSEKIQKKFLLRFLSIAGKFDIPGGFYANPIKSIRIQKPC